MIVRRLAAGAAGLALVGTAFAAAPGHGEAEHHHAQTRHHACRGTRRRGYRAIGDLSGKFVGTSISFPAKLKGKKITHKGGLKLTLGDNFVTIENISINYKSGKASIKVNNSLTNSKIPLKNALVFSGGKNKTKKNGTWKNATVK